MIADALPRWPCSARTAVAVLVIAGIACVLQIGLRDAYVNWVGVSRTEITHRYERSFEHEIYTAWVASHGRVCPPSMSALVPYARDFHDDRDPWGNEFVLACDATGIRVISPGDDGRLGTADDIWSDR